MKSIISSLLDELIPQGALPPDRRRRPATRQQLEPRQQQQQLQHQEQLEDLEASLKSVSSEALASGSKVEGKLLGLKRPLQHTSVSVC